MRRSFRIPFVWLTLLLSLSAAVSAQEEDMQASERMAVENPDIDDQNADEQNSDVRIEAKLMVFDNENEIIKEDSTVFFLKYMDIRTIQISGKDVEVLLKFSLSNHEHVPSLSSRYDFLLAAESTVISLPESGRKLLSKNSWFQSLLFDRMIEIYPFGMPDSNSERPVNIKIELTVHPVDESGEDGTGQ